MSHKHKHEIEEEKNSNNNPFKPTDEAEKVETEVEKQEVEAGDESVNNEADKKYEELQKKYDDLNNQYIRLAADFENFRKRQAQERESLLKYGAEETMKKLLDVLDNFDRGLKAIENIEDCEQVKDSYKLVCKQMNDVLTKLCLEVIESEGQEFDPNFHEAVMQTPTSEHPENTVMVQLQKGYKLGDKVLRPALVNVATAE